MEKRPQGLDKIESDPQRLKWMDQDATLFENEEFELSRLRSMIYKRQMGVIKSKNRN